MLRPHLGAIIPCGITALRIVAAGLLLYALSEGMRPWALTLFLFSCVTDYIDGYLARRLGVCTVLGSYLDATADFLVVLASFTAFVRQGVYPWWTVLVIVSMFLQFIVTSKLGRPIYDPVGKYYGTFLFAAIGVTLLWPHSNLGGKPTVLIVSDLKQTDAAVSEMGKLVQDADDKLVQSPPV